MMLMQEMKKTAAERYDNPLIRLQEPTARIPNDQDPSVKVVKTVPSGPTVEISLRTFPHPSSELAYSG